MPGQPGVQGRQRREHIGRHVPVLPPRVPIHALGEDAPLAQVDAHEQIKRREDGAGLLLAAGDGDGHGFFPSSGSTSGMSTVTVAPQFSVPLSGI